MINARVNEGGGSPQETALVMQMTGKAKRKNHRGGRMTRNKQMIKAQQRNALNTPNQGGELIPIGIISKGQSERYEQKSKKKMKKFCEVAKQAGVASPRSQCPAVTGESTGPAADEVAATAVGDEAAPTTGQGFVTSTQDNSLSTVADAFINDPVATEATWDVASEEGAAVISHADTIAVATHCAKIADEEGAMPRQGQSIITHQSENVVKFAEVATANDDDLEPKAPIIQDSATTSTESDVSAVKDDDEDIVKATTVKGKKQAVKAEIASVVIEKATTESQDRIAEPVSTSETGIVTEAFEEINGGDKEKVDDAPVYEIKPIANKGVGMFVTCYVPRGTRILQEAPLMLLSADEGLLGIAPKFVKLSGKDQASILALASNPSDDDIGRTEMIKMQRKYSPLEAVDLPIVYQLQLMSILETNSFAADGQSALVATAAKMNHSCTPNVYHNWNAELGQLTVHTIRDVSIGEEIVTSYINISAYASHRQEQLKRYRFICDCRACNLKTEFGRVSEERRRRLCAVNREVVMRFLYPDMSKLRSDQDTIKAVMEIMKILEEEDIVHMELARHYRMAAELNVRIGKLVQACEWAEKALELAEICTGTDYEGYKNLKEMLQELIRRRDQVVKIPRAKI